MGGEKNKIKLDILGTVFTIQSEENPEYLEGVINYLKAKVNEVKAGFGITDPLKLSLISALNVVDELLKERKRKDSISEVTPDFLAMEQITERLIKRIDESLIEN